MKADRAGWKLIIFDFDGTLADSFRWFVGHFNHAARKFGFKPILDEEIESFRRLDPECLKGRLELVFWKIPFIAHHMQRLMASEIGHIKAFPGAKAALKHMAKSHTLALVTSNSEDNVRRVLGPAAMAHFKHMEFEVGMFSKARTLKRTARKLGVHVSDTLYIGDEIRDLEAARDAGMSFGAVGWGYCPLDAIVRYQPDAVFKKMTDLRKPLKSSRIS